MKGRYLVKCLNRRNLRGIVILLIGIFFLTGCAATTFKTRPNIAPLKDTKKILLMPMDIKLSTLTAGAVLKPEAEWTANAYKHVEKAIKEQADQIGFHLLCQMDIEKTVLSAEEEQTRIQLIKLYEAVGHSILLHEYTQPFKLPTKNNAFDWSLGPGAKFLKEKYGVDHALFIYLRDSYASGGRVAVAIVAAAFGVGIPLGQQIGFASLIDLETGEVAYFNRLLRGAGDLRTQEAATKSVELLLSGFPK